MKIIRCGNISNNLIMLLLVPVISSINSFAGEWLSNDTLDLNKHPFFIQIFTCLCEIIVGGVLEIILRITNKKTITQETHRHLTFNSCKNINYKKVNLMKKKVTIMVMSLVLLNMVIDCSAMTLMYIKLNTNENDIELRCNFLIIQIIFNGIVSILMLRYPIYKHHYFSIVFLFIGFILVSFQYFTSLSEDLTILYIAICYILWAVQEGVAKWVMKELFISPYFLLCLYGLIGLGLQLVIAVPLSFIPCELDFCSGVVEKYIETLVTVFNNSMISVYLWMYSISVAVYMLFLIMVNNAFNPTHSCTAESFENVFWWIYALVENGVDINFIPSLFGYAIIIFAGLVYNEIVICSICSLNQDTISEIQERSNQDLSISLQEINSKDLAD